MDLEISRHINLGFHDGITQWVFPLQMIDAAA